MPAYRVTAVTVNGLERKALVTAGDVREVLLKLITRYPALAGVEGITISIQIDEEERLG